MEEDRYIITQFSNKVISLNIGWPEQEVIIEQEDLLQNKPEQFKIQKTGQ